MHGNMEIVRVRSPSEVAGAIASAAECLLSGGVIAAPTETVYGLMTLWENPAGRDRIYALKSRPRDRPLQMLSASLGMGEKHGVAVTPELIALDEYIWPAPLTVVCRAVGKYETVGMRIPDSELLGLLLEEVGEPLAGTSANRSGDPDACDWESAVAGLNGCPDLVLATPPIPAGGIPSTVISILSSPWEILRNGPVSHGQIQVALE